MSHRLRLAPPLAITLALVLPVVSAQSGDTTSRRAGSPVQATQTEAVLRESMITVNAPVREQLDADAPPPVAQVEEEEEAMRGDKRRALRITPRPPRAATQRMAWAELDADGDGRITRAEAEVNAGFKSRFESLDANHDGVVTEVEYRADGRRDGWRGRDDATRHDPALDADVGDDSRTPPRPREG